MYCLFIKKANKYLNEVHLLILDKSPHHDTQDVQTKILKFTFSLNQEIVLRNSNHSSMSTIRLIPHLF